MYSTHLRFLEWKIYQIYTQKRNSLSFPTMFEYYGAIHFSEQYHRPYRVWGDITATSKKNHKFQVRDTGVDLTEDTFTHLCQVKYYRAGNMISYSKLANFLAMPLIIGRHDIKMTLFRPSHSLLDRKTLRLIDKGDLEDVVIENDKFLSDVEQIVKSFH